MEKQTINDIGVNALNFLQCDRWNGTFLDCPISKSVLEKEWLISIFNPTLKVKDVANIKLSHPYWKILGFS
jgi:hypothetical protein